MIHSFSFNIEILIFKYILKNENLNLNFNEIKLLYPNKEIKIQEIELPHTNKTFKK